MFINNQPRHPAVRVLPGSSRSNLALALFSGYLATTMNQQPSLTRHLCPMRHPLDRQSLRKNILAARDALPNPERTAKSNAIARQIWQLDAFAHCRAPFIYVHFRSEVETSELINQCLARHKEVSVPLTLTKTKRLDPYHLTNPEQQLTHGYCNIPEPDPEKADLFDASRIDVVILPGSVFDAKGGRLGYGGGYYDRFLADQAPQALRIGIAYELQLVEAVPLLPHDQRLDYLVTDERIIKIK